MSERNMRHRGARFTADNVRDILEFFSGLACCCHNGIIQSINYHGCRLLGYEDPKELETTFFDDLLTSEYRGMDLVQQILETGVPTLALMDLADGSKTGVEIKVQWARELGPDVYIIRAEDVSHRMALSSDILSSEARFRALIDNALDMICSCDNAKINFVNKTGLAMLRVTQSKDIVGAPISSLFHSDYEEVFQTPDALQMLCDDQALFPTKLARSDGSFVDVHVALTQDAGKPGRIMIEVRDISEHRNAVMALHNLNQRLEQKVQERTTALTVENELRRTAEGNLRHIATHDILTNLPNRRLLLDRVDTILHRARRDSQKAALMFIDLDGFKLINDTYGHDAGDLVLKVVAERLLALTRDTDTVARLGGDEFIIAYTDIKKTTEVADLGRNIIEALAAPITLPGKQLCTIGASIGIAIYPDNGDDRDAILKAADDIMYTVKKQGKNSFLFA